MKRCIFIIGMHRSGTSATAGMLHKGGLCLGKDLMEPDWINPAGYFEDAKVIAINSELYHYYKAGLWYPPLMYDDEGQFAVTFQQFIDYYKDVDVVAFKNPRFCATFPIWHKYFTENGIKTEIMFVMRPPEQIVQSLCRTRNMANIVAKTIVNHHVGLIDDIEDNYFISNPIIFPFNVDYQELIAMPYDIYQAIIDSYEINLDPNGYKHIDRSLKHF